MFSRKYKLTYQFLQQGHNPVVVLLLHSSYSFELQCHVFYLPLNTSMRLRHEQHLEKSSASQKK
jgi:hypothetical protein